MGVKGVRVLIGAAAALFAVPFFSFAQANDDVEAKVRSYFADIPVMIPIAKCESGFRQFKSDGFPLMGGAGGTMVGVFQISSGVHASYAKSLGMDIDMLDGNLAYAKYLYQKEGTGPWLSSFSCWNTAGDSAAATSASDASLTLNLSLGMEHSQVATLQKILNSGGFALAAEGPGSPGNETTKFGSLTRVAVRAFQCAKKIACNGDEYSTGYGFVGARTRAALLSALEGTELRETRAASSTPAYTPDQQAEIARLQEQIATLQKTLAELLQKQAS